MVNGVGKHAEIGAAVFLCAVRRLTTIIKARLNVSVFAHSEENRV